MLKVFYRLEVKSASGEWVGPFQGDERSDRHSRLVNNAQDGYGYSSHRVPPIDAYCGDDVDVILTGTHGPDGVLHWFPNLFDFLCEHDARVMRYSTSDVRYEDREQATFVPKFGQDVTEKVLSMI